MRTTPNWYGQRYPSIEMLEAYACDLGALVVRGETPVAFCFMPARDGERLFIGLPEGTSPLDGAWLLAHELGHLVQHTGPRGELLYDKDELAADRWAACALIPQAAVMRYRNACEDAFIGALSRHYEDIPPRDCESRRLAARIARIRLQALLREAS